ncbi:MAG: formate/nitrite transporter family protein [Bacillota bacterium]|nr:formate/nitrite transporter family protein [Bacillota bacterium]
MFLEEFTAAANGAKAKSRLLQEKPGGYLASSMLAGAYIGFGILLIFTIGGLLDGAPYTRIVMGLAFGIALSLVVIAGAELFTGNNLVMAAGVLSGTATVGQLVKLWVVCFLGNWIGSIILATLFYYGGFTEGAVGEFIAATAATKMSIPPVALFIRAVLCNTLVCLATWCSFRCKSDSGKLIMVFWCLFAFITTGFEHSIANMTLLTVSLFAPGEAAISFAGYFYNIGVVTLGNIVGGVVCVALPYYLVSRTKSPAAAPEGKE